MKKLIIVICIAAMLVNIGIFVVFDVLPSDNLKEVDDNDEDNLIEGKVTVDPETFEVTVPEEHIGDIYKYDYHVFMELYSYNETEGEEIYTLTADGTLSIQIQGIESAEDGFKQNHDCLRKQEVTAATAKIVIDTSDSEPFVTHASGTGTRAEYWNLDDERVIKAVTEGVVNIDEIPRAPNIPLTFTGNLRSYPDPNEVLEDSLDETIYLEQQTLMLNDTGIYSEPGISEWFDQEYNWKVDAVENVSGYNAMRVNITAKVFYNWLNFNRLVWITNEVPVPVKAFTRTNQTWGEEDDEEHGYLIAETTRTLRNGSAGFTEGVEKPQWKDTKGDYVSQYPGVETEAWDYAPADGEKFDDTHFQMRPSEAIDYALENSEGLKKFMDKFDNGELICDSALYNFTKTNKDKTDTTGKAGTYHWNLTFGLKFDWYSEEEEEKDEDGQSSRNKSYNILVREIIEKNVITGYTNTFEIPPDQDRGARRGGASYYKSELEYEAVTLGSSVSIFKQDEEVNDNGFDAFGRMEDGFKYGVMVEAIETDERPGLDLIGTLTGINTPSAKFAWWLQQDSVWETGSTFAAAMDAETGQMLFVMEADGNQLNQLFN